MNSKNENCLDIAISRDHIEVVKVLINREDWRSLITFQTDESVFSNKRDENRQLLGLYDKKMWEVFEMILDKCVLKNGYDFSILDRPVNSIMNHPLMLIARSSEEKLVKHEATLTLLNLKWRFLPRFFFYFNILIRTIFLVLMAVFALFLSESTCDCSVELCHEQHISNTFENYSRMSLSSPESNVTTFNTTIVLNGSCVYIADNDLNRLSIECEIDPLVKLSKLFNHESYFFILSFYIYVK